METLTGMGLGSYPCAAAHNLWVSVGLSVSHLHSGHNSMYLPREAMRNKQSNG